VLPCWKKWGKSQTP